MTDWNIFQQNRNTFSHINRAYDYKSLFLCNDKSILTLSLPNIMFYTLPQFILLTCSIQVVRMYFQAEWKTVLFLIRWLLQKLADLDQQCFQGGRAGLNKTRVIRKINKSQPILIYTFFNSKKNAGNLHSVFVR